MSLLNVDPKETEQFAAHAASWWSPEGPLKTLHDINPLRLEWIETQVDLSKCSVLDIGCGGGLLSEAMAQKGAKVTGLDAAAPLIETARAHAKKEGLDIEYHANTLEAFSEQTPDPQFDCITCLELLEHVPNPEHLLKTTMQCLKPGGHLILSTINRTPKAFLGAIVAAEYLLKLLPRGTHQYEKFLSPAQLDAWVRPHNMTLKAMQGLHYNPLKKTYYLDPDVSINYLVCYQRDA